MEAFVAGNNLGIEIEFIDSTGTYITPVSARYTLTDAEGTEIISTTAFVPTEPTHVLSIDAASNTLTGVMIQGYRQINVLYEDEKGSTLSTDFAYIIEASNSLVAGQNSFASLGLLMISATNLSSVDEVVEGELSHVRVALRQAYRNISRLSIYLKLGETIYTRSDELTHPDLALIPSADRQLLIDAQITEANFLLGGNPMEQRRRDGIMSQSVGETSEFYRTKKPLVTPVSRDTMNILSRLLDIKTRSIGRA